MRILFLLFVGVPIAEIYVLIKASGIIGAGWTILAVVGTAVLGAALVKTQGFFTMNSMKNKLAEGQVPAMEVAEGVAILIAGALLMTPGFVTDAFGFACLIPPLRQTVIKNMIKKGVMNVAGQSGVFTSQTVHREGTNSYSENTPNNVIEGDYIESECKEK